MPDQTIVKFFAIYLILLFWTKAGLAGGWVEQVLLVLSIICIFIALSALKRHWSVFKYYFLTAGILTLLFILSYLNPTYRNLTKQDLEELNFSERITEINNIEKAAFISKRMQSVFMTQDVNNIDSLAILLGIKDSYTSTFNVYHNDNVIKIIDVVISRIFLKPKLYIPSSLIKEKVSILKFYFFLFHILAGFVIFSTVTTKSDVRKLCYIFFVNTLILSIVGIYQKINYSFGSNVKEILGIWDAPEPRYYFSTFTYKNHWSCFALISITMGIKLIISPMTFWGLNFIRCKELNLLLVFITVISFTIPFSGSRSGTLLLILLVLSLIFYAILKHKISLKRKLFVFFIIKCLTLIFLSLILFNRNNISMEMKNVSEMQLRDLSSGKMPLRWYLWSDALDAAKQKPFWGYGYETYAAVAQKHQSHHVRSERNKALANAHNPFIPLVAHAHNDIIEWWCEWGLAGMLAFFIPAICIIFAFIQKKSNAESKILLTGVAIAFVYSLIDFPTRTPACLALLSVCFALGLRTSKTNSI